MKIPFFNRRRILFTDKVHPKQGILSAVIGVGAVVFMLFLFHQSDQRDGAWGIQAAYLGFLNLILAIAGEILGIRCFKMEEIYPTTPRMGCVLNGVVILVYFILYITGIFM